MKHDRLPAAVHTRKSLGETDVMKEEVKKLSILADDIKKNAIQIKIRLAGIPVGAQIREALAGIDKFFSAFLEALKSEEIEPILHTALGIGIYGLKLGRHTSDMNLADCGPIIKNLLDQSETLTSLAEEGPLTLRPLDEDTQALQNLTSDNIDSRASVSKRVKETKKLLDELGTRLSYFEDSLKDLEGLAAVEIQKITKAYEAAKTDIDEKTNHINRVTGQAAARMVAGDYDGSAANEKKAADNLRYLALSCMLLIVGLLGWAVFESTSTTFEWERFLSKISLVFLLGVPAAYLARESAKHREQQYHHLQTSLDMKAISPFLASLPDEEQHKLKALIATRIFGGRDFSKVGNDPYPINTQEIIMKIIEKADFSNKSTKDSDNPDGR